MASWLKAAEDLFEVVDRRAKLVVSDLADEQSDSPTPASNGQGSQARRTKSRTKLQAQKRLSTNESQNIGDTAQEQAHTNFQLDLTPDRDRAAPSAVENERTPSGKTPNNEQEQGIEKDTPSTPSTGPPANASGKHDADLAEVPVTVTDADTAVSTSNGELLNENASDVHVEQSPSSLLPKEIGIANEDHSNDAGEKIKSEDADVPLKTDNERSLSVVVEPPVNSGSPLKDIDSKVDTVATQKKQQEHKMDSPPTKVQDQLDEAQGLLKTAISTGQSKEARLARVCAGLSSRLQEYKSENAQLEELLVAERELSRSFEARIKQLQQELSASKSEVTKVESNMAEALAAKNSEIEALVSSIDTLKKQAALSEGNLASLQMNMESIMRNRELTETRMMQAVREELASAERRAEEERAAHNATKMAAMEREVELEHRAVEASTALARVQRVADERTAKVGDLEQKVAVLELECATLNQELQDMEARARRGQKKSPDEANQVIQVNIETV
ncbi:hypothetical protein Pint_13260 [Pistacia integerrima]|uniref:Uncharacterized protein n=1 Tax=Pistacia integerrima TaxID=434235 RepID=A0ACC0YCE4_9ROSI|nr:hypothetical protein Pint_13260 [Pistacia integerrima]